jgi:hypothetical protein
MPLFQGLDSSDRCRNEWLKAFHTWLPWLAATPWGCSTAEDRAPVGEKTRASENISDGRKLRIGHSIKATVNDLDVSLAAQGGGLLAAKSGHWASVHAGQLPADLSRSCRLPGW